VSPPWRSGNFYLRARYYDPSTGQFISRDPKVSKTGTPYAYVADNPQWSRLRLP
jgi:RHS repeat-associated protein